MPAAPGAPDLQALFLPSKNGTGQRFALYHRPPGPRPVSTVLFIHALADEMNKSRRMVAMAARTLARAGHAVLQIDLFGCGDSSGDSGEATWSQWIDDVRDAADWLAARHDGAPLIVWGHRAGCLLAARLAADRPAMLLFWQPAVDGKAVLTQLLRLRLAAGLQPETAAPKVDSRALRAEWLAGQAVLIAGYEVSPALAAGLEASTLAAPATPTRSAWLEVGTREPSTLTPASEGALARWRAAGHAVHAEAVNGPAFWQTQEIEDAPALLAATLAAVDWLLVSKTPGGTPAIQEVAT